MNTVSIIKKLNGKRGFYVRWYEHVPGVKQKRPRYKKLNNRNEAEMYRQWKYQQLNSDVYREIEIEYDRAVDLFLQSYKIRGLADTTYKGVESILRRFTSGLVNPPVFLHSLIQDDLDAFFRGLDCGQYRKRGYALVLNTFLGWCRARCYRVQSISCPGIKVVTKSIQVISLWTVYRLWIKADMEMRQYLLLLLLTGLRAEDVKALTRENLDLKNCTIRTVARKTGKEAIIPIPQMAAESKIVHEIRDFSGITRSKWEKLCLSANLAKTGIKWQGKTQVISRVTRQDFRRLHSTLIQAGPGLKLAQQALQHSDKRTTRQHYTDELYVMRRRVEEVFGPILEKLLNHQ